MPRHTIQEPERPSRRMNAKTRRMNLQRCAWGAALALCVGVFACAPPIDEDKLREEVVAADPRFARVLEKRDAQAERTELLEHELALKRDHVERQIQKLRRELKESATRVEEQIKKIKRLVAPDQERVTRALAMASEEHRAKRNQRTTLKRSYNRLRGELQHGSAELSAEERSHMQHEIEELGQEVERAGQEIVALNEHIRLLKIKRRLLRF